MKTFNIGDTAYAVRHCPFNPTEKEKEEILRHREIVDEAYDHEEERIFESLSKAIAFARKVVRSDFWGFATVFEAKLVNPYSDEIPDCLLKPSARRWRQIEGGYECEIER